MDADNRKAIVVGANHINMLGIVRSLGEMNIKSHIILFKSNIDLVNKSKYIASINVADKPEKIVGILLKKFGNEETKPVIFTTGDVDAAIIDRELELLKERFIFPNAKVSGRITHFMSKQNASILANKHGIKHPQTWIIDKEKSDKVSLMNISYPCITKSLMTIMGGKSDVYICEDEAQLLKNLTKIKSSKVIIQQYIDKITEVDLLGISLQNGNKILLPTYEVFDKNPKGHYGTQFTHIINHDNLYGINNKRIREFIQEIGYEGLFSVEFIIDKKTKNAYFMEINLRNDAFTYSITSMGINLPYIWYKQDFPNKISLKREKCKVISEVHDFIECVIHGKENIFKWIISYLNRETKLWYNRKDKAPFYYYILSKLKRKK